MRCIHLALLASILVFSACESDDSAGSALSNAQVGGVAQQICSLTESAVQNAIAEEGASGGPAPVVARLLTGAFNGLGAMHMPVQATPQPIHSFSYEYAEIDFSAAGNLNATIDLSTSTYPNATGTLYITATATGLTGDQSSGSVSYNNIVVTTADDVSVTDPNSGAVASWPNGTTFNYTVSVTWTYTSATDWSYTTNTTSNATDRSVTVTGNGGTYVGEVDQAFTWNRTISRSASTISVVFNAFNGTRDVTWTDQGDASTHEVNWVINSLTDIEVTVDGFTFNFSSVAALIALLNVNFQHDN